MRNYYFFDTYINEEGDYGFIYEKDINFKGEIKGHLLIAESPSDYFIYRSDFDEKNLPNGVQKLPLALKVTLQSAEGYLPAIALARDEIIISCKNKTNISKNEFSEIYISLLKKHLEEQVYKGYFLAEFLSNNSDEFSKEEFVWIVGYDPVEDFVKCVSSLYLTYMYPSKYFNFNRKYLDVFNNPKK